ncbi:hypothetical protein BGZ47_009398 [Haplosporangium gracile]|nr:hypothetical protein BGZ47_009398 [Haplosporangium gracile]
MSTSIEDNELPKAILTRIMKQALPENTNIQANAKLAMTKSTTLFINYLASAANEVAGSVGHKIISGAHVLKALETVDLEEMLPRLTEELQAAAAQATKDKDNSSLAAGSKKRKPVSDESSSAAKFRKSSTSVNPRDGQDTPRDMLTDGEDKEDDDEEEEDEDEDEDEEEDEEEGEGDDAKTSKPSKEKSLNMNEPEQEGKQEDADADEDDDSDGF